MKVIDTMDLACLYTQLLRDVRWLDLGSGPTPEPGYHGIDLCGDEDDRVTPFDLASGLPWPVADGSIERLRASHFIEHIPASDVSVWEFVEPAPSDSGASPVSWQRASSPTPRARQTGRQDALCWFMQEAWRVAAPGAKFHLRWPSLVFEARGELQALPFFDPTHRRFIPRQQIEIYFNRAGRAAWGVEHYPLSCDWQVMRQTQVALGSVGYEYDYTLVKREGAL